jgi:hypothetical protein
MTAREAGLFTYDGTGLAELLACDDSGSYEKQDIWGFHTNNFLID